MKFAGKDYREGVMYHYDDLPAQAKRDASLQFDEHDEVSNPEDALYEFGVVPREKVKEALLERFEFSEDELFGPYVRRLARDIGRRGLKSPPVGDEGWHRAAAMVLLGRDVPYFSIVRPDHD